MSSAVCEGGRGVYKVRRYDQHWCLTERSAIRLQAAQKALYSPMGGAAPRGDYHFTRTRAKVGWWVEVLRHERVPT